MRAKMALQDGAAMSLTGRHNIGALDWFLLSTPGQPMPALCSLPALDRGRRTGRAQHYPSASHVNHRAGTTRALARALHEYQKAAKSSGHSATLRLAHSSAHACSCMRRPCVGMRSQRSDACAQLEDSLSIDLSLRCRTAVSAHACEIMRI